MVFFAFKGSRMILSRLWVLPRMRQDMPLVCERKKVQFPRATNNFRLHLVQSVPPGPARRIHQWRVFMISRVSSSIRRLAHSRRPLRKFHSENQMPVAPTIHLLTCPCSIRPINERDKSKAFGPARVSILGQEHSRDTAKSFEEIAQFLFFCHLGHLGQRESTSASHNLPK